MLRVFMCAAMVGLVGCKNEPTPPDPISPGVVPVRALEQLQSCDELRDYLSDVMLESVLGHRYGYAWWGSGYDLAGEAGADDSGPSDYTTTNVQEAGVDEIDIVKTDGEHIFVATEQAVYIVDSWPVADSEVVATIELDGWARGLFLQGDQLVVFEHVYADPTMDVFGGWGSSRIRVVDISNRSAPEVTRTIDVEGWLVDGRLIEDDVYLVTNHWTTLPDEVWSLAWDDSIALPELDWTLTGAAFEMARAEALTEARVLLEPRVAEVAATMDLDAVLPEWVVQEAGAPQASPELMLACADLYRPQDPSQYSTLSVLHLSLDTGAMHTTGILSDGWEVYASADNLYVAQTSWWSWWGWDELDMTSNIHKFQLDSATGASYVGSGAVEGWLYDQFAMSEYDGLLRVVSTDQDWWWGATDEDEEQPANNVFVLQDDGQGRLQELGALRGIAPGEQIYAARMMGDRGYLVTFRQVDPLFTIDLSNPTAPRLAGELEMPGYSAYLHPMGEDHLLAVGMAGEETGTLTGLAVNLFDVSDFDHPQLVEQYALTEEGWSWSEALWDHHAFTFHRGVLSIPAYFDHYDTGQQTWDYFSGLVVFEVDTSGIEEIGRVDHRELVEQSECLYTEYWYYEPWVCDDIYWYATVRRSVYIEDNLFSISDYGIKVNELNNPDVEIASVLFHPAIP